MSDERSASAWITTIVNTGRWYLLSSMLTKALALLSVTILTRNLSPADFGSLNALLALTQALPIILSLYLDSALARFYHEYRLNRHQLADLFSTVFWFVLAWSTASLVLISQLFAELAVEITSVPLAYLWIVIVPMLMLQLAQFGMAFLRQSFESRTVTKIEVWASLIGVVTTYILVAIWNEGVLGRLLALALSSIYAFAIVVWHFVRAQLLVFRFDRRQLNQCLLYSLPLLPNLAAGWIVTASDRLIIAKYVDFEAVGMYSLATTIAALLYVIQDAVTQVTGVKTQIGMSTNRIRTMQMISEFSSAMWVVMLFVDYCASLYSAPFVWILTGRDYYDAAGLIGVCGFVYVVSPQGRILQDIISFHKHTWIISTGALIMAFCSLSLNLLLIPRFGYVVAPYVLIFALLMQFSWLYGWVYNFEKLTLPWGRMLISFVVFLGFVRLDKLLLQDDFVIRFWGTILYAAISYGLLRKSLKTLKLGPA